MDCFFAMNSFTEKKLLCRLAAGDPMALTTIYQEHWQSLFIAAYNILRDKKTCEDIIQEIFMQLWLRRESLQVRESLKTYLMAATRHQVFHSIKKSAAQQALPLHLTERIGEMQADAALLQKEVLQRVEATVVKMPEKCRQIYRLSREEALSHREIAQRLNISIKTVENQITIALRRLRHSLENVFFLLILFCH